MIMLDNSGSMFNFAYYDTDHPDYGKVLGTHPAVTQPYITNFDPGKTYYGYFNSGSWYTYSNNRFSVAASKTAQPTIGTNQWDGNFLNWLTMRRVDVIRKILTGGRVVAEGGENRIVGQGPDDPDYRGRYKEVSNAEYYTPYSGTQLFDVTISGSVAVIKVGTGPNVPSYNIKIVAGTTPTGILQSVGTNARWGLTFYNGSAGGNVVRDVKERSLANLTSEVLNDINNTAPDSNTPLAETLWTVTNYFSQTTSLSSYSSYEGSFTKNANSDPFNFGTGGQQIWADCAKNFVLLITDGQPCADGNLSSTLLNYAQTQGSPWYCTSSAACGLPSCSAGGNVPGLESVALFAHTHDLRTETVMPDKQILDIYTVFAFGQGGDLLKNTAINGGFTDGNNNNIPDLQSEWDQYTYTYNATTKAYDVTAGQDNIPDNYYEATEGDALEASILAAINQMLNKTASGTSVAVLATSSAGEGALFQAYFEPKDVDLATSRTVRWKGHLQGLWLDTKGNLREDTVNDGKLVYTDDYIIEYSLDADNKPVIQRYQDTDGDGEADVVVGGTVPLSDAEPLWDAGKLLALKTAASRTIYTFIDSDADGIADTGEFTTFTSDTTKATALQPYLRASTVTEAQNIINFIRGEQITGYRERRLTVEGVADQVWKLGDIVYSTPTVSGRPAGNYQITYGHTTDGISYLPYYTKYKDRETLVFAGANDGMLHAFYAGEYHSGPVSSTSSEAGWFENLKSGSGVALGDELWAYIPCNVLPHLKWLTDPTYGDNTHIYYVDLKPRIADVRMFTNDTDHPNGWGTVLIGGMRFGGGPITGTGSLASRTFRSAYFCLDITVPDQPKLLWEYTNADLGYTASYPTVAKVGDKWFAVFGSGPTNLARGDCDNTAGNASGPGVNGKIFIVDIATGTTSQIFTTAENRAFLTDPIAIDTDLDFNNDRVYIGETYDPDISGVTYGGKMYRLWTKDSSGAVNQNPTTWAYSNNPSVLFSTNEAGNGKSQPLTSGATAAFDESFNLWVYFGTGKFMGTTDKTDSFQQAFYGIKEPCSKFDCTTKVDNNDTSLFNSTGVTINQASGGSVTVSGAGSSTWNALLSEAAAHPGGWYHNLSTPTGAPSERVIYRPVAYGGVLLFTTFIPNNAVCGFGGTSYLYALNYLTGTANNSPVIGKTGTTINKQQSLGAGMASGVALHVVASETGGTSNDVEKAYIQMSTGVIVQADITTELLRSGTTAWRETK
jgi:Tfp pilus assembly protein, tip-associated adhesin PilY1